MTITVMLPSRKRVTSLMRSLYSLRALAWKPHSLQFIVASDPDDPATSIAVRKMGAAFEVIVAPARYGYNLQQHYYNAMLHYATGDWLMVWGDDAMMETQRWDSIINDESLRASNPAVLWPKSNGPQHANCFPIIPAAWALELGQFTPSAHPDTYWQHLAQALGRHVKIPIDIRHNRYDLTGSHDDATYAEGRGLLGPEGMADHFADPDAVAADAERIRCAGLL